MRVSDSDIVQPSRYIVKTFAAKLRARDGVLDVTGNKYFKHFSYFVDFRFNCTCKSTIAVDLSFSRKTRFMV
jgi:hypothetical protein